MKAFRLPFTPLSFAWAWDCYYINQDGVRTFVFLGFRARPRLITITVFFLMIGIRRRPRS